MSHCKKKVSNLLNKTYYKFDLSIALSSVLNFTLFQ